MKTTKLTTFFILLFLVCGCTTTKKQQQVDKQKFINEIQKIQIHKYSKASIDCKIEIKDKDGVIQNERSEEYNNLLYLLDYDNYDGHEEQMSFAYSVIPSENQNPEILFDEDDTLSVIGDNIHCRTNLLNYELFFDFYESLDYVTITLYINPFAVKLSSEGIDHYEIEYDKYGYIVKMHSLMFYMSEDDGIEATEDTWLEIEYK